MNDIDFVIAVADEHFEGELEIQICEDWDDETDDIIFRGLQMHLGVGATKDPMVIAGTARDCFIAMAGLLRQRGLRPKCDGCGGEGVCDTGGVYPWGSPINVPCPECNATGKQP